MTARASGVCVPAQLADEAFDAGVAAGEAVVVHQVLLDGFGVAALAERQFDEVASTARRRSPWRSGQARQGRGTPRWPVLNPAATILRRRWWRRSAVAVADGANSAPESGDTSLAGFAGGGAPQPPGGRTATPAAFK